MRMIGNVRLENGGGFIQASLDLAPSGQTFDASNFSGVRLMVRGNAEQYSVHLVPQIMSGLGSPTGFISLRSGNGRPFNYRSKNFYPIGSTPRWQRGGFAEQGWSPLDVHSKPT